MTAKVLVRVSQPGRFTAGMVYSAQDRCKWKVIKCAPILRQTARYQPTPYAARWYWEKRGAEVEFLDDE